ncbi:spore germination protein [Paenibacillus sp. 2TAB26]|uniref:spore germination protein n=1 Tax=Paenibacillus sp. 2TAB26 TaxID=3233005 RepID=UPI003F9C359B
MAHLVRFLKQHFAHSDDFAVEMKETNGGQVTLCYLKSLVDTSQNFDLLKRIPELIDAKEGGDNTAPQMESKSNISESEAVNEVLIGNLVLVHRTGNLSLKPTSRSLQRSIDTPQSESPTQGASDAFTESLDSNIGILRIHLRSDRLAIRQLEMGVVRKRSVAVCHIQGKNSCNIVIQIVSLLEEQSQTEVGNIQDLARILGQRKWSPVPLFYTSEMPEQAVALLLKGRVLLLLDQMPYALIAPPKLMDLWNIYSDRNMQESITLFLQGLRILGLLIALLVPGLYVAFVDINPELFRIDMALSVAKSREGVPYPPLFEMLLMLIVIEMIVGASVRLPKSIGPTITMVGGIILGQAAVQAQLVSNLLLIVVAASIIANFTFVGLQNALMIRLFKYVIVILGSIFGILGIFAGLVWLLFYLSGITTFQVPYLSLDINPEESHE